MNNKEEKFAAEELKVNQELAKVARERLEFDKSQAASEKRFWKMGAGPRVTIFLTIAAMIVTPTVSILRVWESNRDKDKEIEVSRKQKQFELEKFDAQKKLEWDMKRAEFVLTHEKAIFNGTPQEQQFLAQMIPAIFPNDISKTLLERLENASPPQAKVIWRQARSRLDAPSQPSANETATIAAAAVTPSSKTFTPITTNSLASNLSGIDSLTKWGPTSPANDGVFTNYLSNSSSRESLNIPVGLSNISSGLITDAIYRPAPTLNSPTPFESTSTLAACSLCVSIFPAPLASTFKSLVSPEAIIAGAPVASISNLSFFNPENQASTRLLGITPTPIAGARDEIQNSLRLGAGIETPILTMQNRTSVSGTVVDAETGAPMLNATVELLSPIGYQLIGSGVTDALGSFHIELPLDSSSLGFDQIELRVSSKGYSSTTKELRSLSATPVSRATISLQRATLQ